MYIVEDKVGAIALMLAALCFLGTWPAVMTLLERRGRLPQHTYLDYSITNLLAAVIIALTFGQIGGSMHGMPNFFTQLTQVVRPTFYISLFWAVCSGIFWKPKRPLFYDSSLVSVISTLQINV